MDRISSKDTADIYIYKYINILLDKIYNNIINGAINIKEISFEGGLRLKLEIHLLVWKDK